MIKFNKIINCDLFKQYGLNISFILKKKRIRYSLYIAFFLTIVCYFIDNCPVLTGESMNQLFFIDRYFHKSKTNTFEDVVFCNTSYDLDLVPVPEIAGSEFADTLGYNTITDRKKLYDFLVLLQKSDTYKYIIIDLAFDKNDQSRYDDILYDKILEMRDIVVANDDGFELTPKLEDKGIDGLDIFYVTKANTSFTRFKYSENNQRSIPLLVFEKLYPEKSIKHFGKGYLSLYFSGSHLCYNSNFITFDDKYTGEKDYIKDQIDGTAFFMPQYATLNSFLKKALNENELVKETASETKNKIIIIGDFKHDVHDTYAGDKPGPVIVARALQYLIDGKNLVDPWHLMIWFIIFFGISYFIFRDELISVCYNFCKEKLGKIKIINNIKKRAPILSQIKKSFSDLINKSFLKGITPKFIYLLTSLITYSVILWVCSGIEYAVTYKVHSIILPLLFFSLLKLAVQYYYKFK